MLRHLVMTEMPKYKITVNAIGYETTSLSFYASNKEFAKRYETAAIRHFATHNSISFSDAKGLGFVSYENQPLTR